MSLLITITATSNEAKKIERSYGDITEVRWLGSVIFEKHQILMVKVEISVILDIAEKLGISTSIIMSEPYSETDMYGEFDESTLPDGYFDDVEYIEPELTERMTDYNFPGNVRELRNMVERAIILCDKNSIGWENFRFSLPIEETVDYAEISATENLDLAEIEKKVILKALDRASQNKSKAAELLNITWQSLDRRMAKHKLK